MTTATAAATTTTSSSSWAWPDGGAVQRVAARALRTPAVRVEGWRCGDGAVVRSFRLQAAGSAEGFYVLRWRASAAGGRLLRHEHGRLQTEAGALRALRGTSGLLVPRLIECSHTSATAAAAAMGGGGYVISGPFDGAVLSHVEPRMSAGALASVDQSLGRHVRRMAQVAGTAFGAVRRDSSRSSRAGTSSWSRCFAGVLESVLRDAEDALVSLPYHAVRDQVRAHRSRLDQIAQPRLFLLEMVDDRNLLVDPATWTVSGVLDFSTAMWGDPFMSDCFCNPSLGFVEGFGTLPNSTTDERIRQYLYVLYHALLAIVRQRYRPSEGGDELGARRNLTAALTALSTIGR